MIQTTILVAIESAESLYYKFGSKSAHYQNGTNLTADDKSLIRFFYVDFLQLLHYDNKILLYPGHISTHQYVCQLITYSIFFRVQLFFKVVFTA